MGIIKSILDNDLYKFTMQQAVLHCYPQAQAEYRFKNRGRHKFTSGFLHSLQSEIKAMEDLELLHYEAKTLSNLSFVQPWYVGYLEKYRFNSSQIYISLDNEGNLTVRIEGHWYETILWEVPLMAIISELYFSEVETDWDKEALGTANRARDKAHKLTKKGCTFADFGTRRRRSYQIHKQVLGELITPEFVGTSNVHLSRDIGRPPIGTMAHEWVQAISALESINHANRYMMAKWSEFYGGNLGIALTDTYGLRAFLVDFDPYYAKLFDGVRHDSGCPYELADRVCALYKKYGINPLSKTIVFSDGLDVDKAVSINAYCNKLGIRCSFGIGTNFTNDFPGSPPLNMVIKLWKINGMPVCKLSEDAGKATGDEKAISVARTIYGV